MARNTRFIYIHAYQSYVWNRAVSERLAKFGRKVLVGDLAIRKEQAYLLDNLAAQDDGAAAQDSDNEEEAQPKKTGGDPSDYIVDVTAENLHEFTLYEVVMPMVGHDTKMPQNPDL